MKTTRIQFNAKDFKVTRDIIGAYFGATYDLTISLAEYKTKVANYEKVVATDREELARIALGDTEGIIRSVADIKLSLATNNANIAKYKAVYDKVVVATEKAVTAGIALFDNKDSDLYKAYCEYVMDTTDDNYNAYAEAMASKFRSFGLNDATADNVAHFMPNADRALRGRTAVKKGDIQAAMTSKNFALAVLRKIRIANRDAFSSKKFLDYVEKCKAQDAKKSK